MQHKKRKNYKLIFIVFFYYKNVDFCKKILYYKNQINIELIYSKFNSELNSSI